jgi:hypothetical protein
MLRRLYHPPNFLIMTATELRTDLLQQIEQADEKLLRIVSSVLEAVKVEYVAALQNQDELTDEDFAELPVPNYKRLTKAESDAELKEAIAQCERGDVLTLAELDKEMTTW